MTEKERASLVQVNENRVRKVAELLRSLPEVKPFDFTGSEFPPVGHPEVLDFFFASTLQQFGFWYAFGGKYCAPMIAKIDGRDAKGSDYLWRAYLRKISEGGFYSPSVQAHQTQETSNHF